MTKVLALINKLLRVSHVKQDLRTIRDSTYFNKAYYQGYLPILKYLRIDPCLHYLLVGANNGRDPGPNFDTSWYIDNIVNDPHAGTNPLIHYHEFSNGDVPTFSGSAGKHIEFFGLPGSGKTTHYKIANKFLKTKLGYEPGPTRYYRGMLEDKRFKAMSRFNHKFVISCLRGELPLLNYVVDENYYSDKLQSHQNNINNLLFSYIIILCFYYYAVSLDKAKPWIMFDDGFYRNFARYFQDKNDNFLVTQQTNDLLNMLPCVDLIINIDVDVDQCIDRMKARKEGIPGPYRRLSDRELASQLHKSRTRTSQYISYLQDNTPISIVTIDNNQNLQAVKKQLLSIVGELFQTK